MKTTNLAFTLIELLIALLILSILLSLALPSFGNLLERKKVSANVERLVHTLQQSRLRAITDNVKVTICPTVDGLNCSNNWSKGYMSFVDQNGNRQFDVTDSILFQYHSFDQQSELHWRAFGIRKSLQWLDTGITNHQNGTFTVCYAKKLENARGLFLTKAGRIRYSRDNNGDGYHENATGAALRCG